MKTLEDIIAEVIALVATTERVIKLTPSEVAIFAASTAGAVAGLEDPEDPAIAIQAELESVTGYEQPAPMKLSVAKLNTLLELL